MRPHNVRVDEEGHRVLERESDRGKRAQLEVFLEGNWRTIMTLIWISVGWIVVNLYQPIKRIPDLIKNDSTRTADHVSIVRKVDRMEGAILTLSRISCFGLDRDDRIKYNIDCTNIPLPEQGGTSTR